MPQFRKCIAGCPPLTGTVHDFPSEKEPARRDLWLQIFGKNPINCKNKKFYACHRHFSSRMRQGRRIHKLGYPDQNLRKYNPNIPYSHKSAIPAEDLPKAYFLSMQPKQEKIQYARIQYNMIVNGATDNDIERDEINVLDGTNDGPSSVNKQPTPQCILKCEGGRVFRRLPLEETDFTRRNQWLFLLGMDPILHTGNDIYVCDQHFDEEMVDPSNEQEIVYPNKNLPPPLQDSIPDDMEAQTKCIQKCTDYKRKYSFPSVESDIERRKMWLTIFGLDPEFYNHDIYACDRHFSDQMRSDRYLIPYAIPDQNIKPVVRSIQYRSLQRWEKLAENPVTAKAIITHIQQQKQEQILANFNITQNAKNSLEKNVSTPAPSDNKKENILDGLHMKMVPSTNSNTNEISNSSVSYIKMHTLGVFVPSRDGYVESVSKVLAAQDPLDYEKNSSLDWIEPIEPQLQLEVHRIEKEDYERESEDECDEDDGDVGDEYEHNEYECYADEYYQDDRLEDGHADNDFSKNKEISMRSLTPIEEYLEDYESNGNWNNYSKKKVDDDYNSYYVKKLEYAQAYYEFSINNKHLHFTPARTEAAKRRAINQYDTYEKDLKLTQARSLRRQVEKRKANEDFNRNDAKKIKNAQVQISSVDVKDSLGLIATPNETRYTVPDRRENMATSNSRVAPEGTLNLKDFAAEANGNAQDRISTQLAATNTADRRAITNASLPTGKLPTLLGKNNTMLERRKEAIKLNSAEKIITAVEDQISTQLAATYTADKRAITNASLPTGKLPTLLGKNNTMFERRKEAIKLNSAEKIITVDESTPTTKELTKKVTSELTKGVTKKVTEQLTNEATIDLTNDNVIFNKKPLDELTKYVAYGTSWQQVVDLVQKTQKNSDTNTDNNILTDAVLKGTSWQEVRKIIEKQDKNSGVANDVRKILNDAEAKADPKMPVVLVKAGDKFILVNRNIELEKQKIDAAQKAQELVMRKQLSTTTNSITITKQNTSITGNLQKNVENLKAASGKIFVSKEENSNDMGNVNILTSKTIGTIASRTMQTPKIAEKLALAGTTMKPVAKVPPAATTKSVENIARMGTTTTTSAEKNSLTPTTKPAIAQKPFTPKVVKFLTIEPNKNLAKVKKQQIVESLLEVEENQQKAKEILNDDMIEQEVENLLNVDVIQQEFEDLTNDNLAEGQVESRFNDVLPENQTQSLLNDAVIEENVEKALDDNLNEQEAEIIVDDELIKQQTEIILNLDLTEQQFESLLNDNGNEKQTENVLSDNFSDKQNQTLLSGEDDVTKHLMEISTAKNSILNESSSRTSHNLAASKDTEQSNDIPTCILKCQNFKKLFPFPSHEYAMCRRHFWFIQVGLLLDIDWPNKTLHICDNHFDTNMFIDVDSLNEFAYPSKALKLSTSTQTTEQNCANLLSEFDELQDSERQADNEITRLKLLIRLKQEAARLLAEITSAEEVAKPISNDEVVDIID